MQPLSKQPLRNYAIISQKINTTKSSKSFYRAHSISNGKHYNRKLIIISKVCLRSRKRKIGSSMAKYRIDREQVSHYKRDSGRKTVLEKADCQ